LLVKRLFDKLLLPAEDFFATTFWRYAVPDNRMRIAPIILFALWDFGILSNAGNWLKKAFLQEKNVEFMTPMIN
jgi:hypothetical protein